MPENDRLDRVIDSALANYADGEANPEIARRVLERISAEAPPARRRRGLIWAIALPVAAGLLIFAAVFGPQLKHRPVGNATQVNQTHEPNTVAKDEFTTTQRPTSSGSAKVSRRSAQPDMTTAAAKIAPLPKRDVFPTPEPLTPEEQALVEFAAHAPEAERKALVETRKQIDEPLSVANIEVPPLEIRPLGPPEPDKN